MSVFQVQKLQFGAADSNNTVMLTNRKHHNISVDVTYDPCGGYFLDDESTENKTISYILSKKYTTMPEAKKVGFGFQGWHTTQNSPEGEITQDSIVSYDISALYAYWVAGYTVFNQSPGGYPIEVVTDTTRYNVAVGNEVQGLLTFSIEREDGGQFSHIDVYDSDYINQLTTLQFNESYTTNQDIIVEPYAGYRINQAYGIAGTLTVEFADYYNDNNYWSVYDSTDLLSDVITLTRIDDYTCTQATLYDDNYNVIDVIYLDNNGYCYYTLYTDVYAIEARGSFTVYLNSYSGSGFEINYNWYSSGDTMYDVDYLYLGNSSGNGIFEVYDGYYAYSVPAQYQENYPLYRNESNSFSVTYYEYYLVTFNTSVSFTLQSGDGYEINVQEYDYTSYPCGQNPNDAYFYIPSDCPISYMDVHYQNSGTSTYYPGDYVYLGDAYTYIDVTAQ